MSQWGNRRVWTEETIIAAIQQFEAREHRWPVTQDFDTCDSTALPHRTTVLRVLGPLAEARRRAGAEDGGAEGHGGGGRGGGWPAGRSWPSYARRR